MIDEPNGPATEKVSTRYLDALIEQCPDRAAYLISDLINQAFGYESFRRADPWNGSKIYCAIMG